MLLSLPSAPGAVTVCVPQPRAYDTSGADESDGTAPKKLGGRRCAQSQGTSFLNVY